MRDIFTVEFDIESLQDAAGFTTVWRRSWARR